jgi:hypothetical protein
MLSTTKRISITGTLFNPQVRSKRINTDTVTLSGLRSLPSPRFWPSIFPYLWPSYATLNQRSAVSSDDHVGGRAYS